MINDLIRQLDSLQRQFDAMVKPEVSLPQLVLLSETVLTGSVASITFSSISQAYRHLLLICQARTDRSSISDGIDWQANADSGNNYDRLEIAMNEGAVSVAGSRATSSGTLGISEAANSRADNFAPGFTLFPFFSQSDNEKWSIYNGAVFKDTDADADLTFYPTVSRWRDTDPITSLVLSPTTGPNFVSGCRFDVYGVL